MSSFCIILLVCLVWIGFGVLEFLGGVRILEGNIISGWIMFVAGSVAVFLTPIQFCPTGRYLAQQNAFVRQSRCQVVS